MRTFCFILILVLLSSCSHEDKRTLRLEHETVAVPSDVLLGRPYQIASDGEFLILADGLADKYFHVFDIKKNQYAGNFGPHGSGPTELTDVHSLVNVNGKFYFTDMNRYKSYELLVGQGENPLDFADQGFNFKHIHSFVIPLGFGHYATTGIYEKGWVKLVDKDDHELCAGTDCPKNDADENTPNQIRAFAYQGMLSYNGDDKLVMTTCYAKQIYVYKIEGDSLNCISSLTQSFPQYRDASAELQRATGHMAAGASLGKDNSMGYIGVYAAADGLYALYSGSSMGTLIEEGKNLMESDELIFYNYDLQEVQTYKLDIPLKLFTVDERTRTVYGISNIPEPTLVKFKLP